MVLVSVGDENPPDLVLVFDQVANVGDDHVDAVHVVIGETHAAVYHHDVTAVFIDGEVFADLVETAERNDLQFFSHTILLVFDLSSSGLCTAGRKTTGRRTPLLSGPASPGNGVSLRLMERGPGAAPLPGGPPGHPAVALSSVLCVGDRLRAGPAWVIFRRGEGAPATLTRINPKISKIQYNTWGSKSTA